MIISRFYYDGAVRSAYDGDTITADIKLGLGFVAQEQKCRLLGINTKEINDKASKTLANQARDRLIGLTVGKDVLLRTKLDKLEKYGRILVTIWPVLGRDKKTGDVTVADRSVNQILVDEGLAVPFMEMLNYFEMTYKQGVTGSWRDATFQFIPTTRSSTASSRSRTIRKKTKTG